MMHDKNVFDNVLKAANIIKWLDGCYTVFAEPLVNIDQIKALQKSLMEHVTPFDPVGITSEETKFLLLAVNDFLKSPLILQDWTVRARDLLLQDGTNHTLPLVEEYESSLGRLRDLRCGNSEYSVAQCGPDDLAALTGANVPSDVFDKARTWASEVQDSLLQVQLSAMKLIVDAVRSLSLVETYLGQKDASGKIMRIGHEQTKVLRDCRSRCGALAAFVEASGSVLNLTSAPADVMHMILLDRVLRFETLSTAVAADFARVHAACKALWCRGLSELIAAVNAFTPEGWEPFKSKVLQTPGVVQAFVAMPQKQYERLGPLARHIDSEIVLIKSVGQQFLDPNLEKQARNARDLAVTTAVYKFVVTCVRKDWLTVLSLAECEDNVRQLRPRAVRREVVG